MTDNQYAVAVMDILLQSKDISLNNLEAIDGWLGNPDYDDWDWLIEWLYAQPGVPIIPKRRMYPEDYAKNSLG